jgi:broad specificity phosphatase PhoE
MKPKVQIPHEIANSHYLFVRHGESEANVASRTIGKANLSDSKLYDARLTQAGIAQCEESITRDYLHETALEYVMVSPMRRAMQTAYHLLKDHPQFATIQFIVEPLCRENIHGTCDMPSTYSQMKAFAESLFPNVDTESRFTGYSDREVYFVEDL